MVKRASADEKFESSPVARQAVFGSDGGDEACWLDQVCDACGAINQTPAASCWRCGSFGSSEEE